MSGFVSADIEKLMTIPSRSEEAIAEFDSIKDEFDRINQTLLSKWSGQGADAYEQEADHILENIGGISDVLNSITNGVLKDIIDAYNKLDEDLDASNRSAGTEGEG